MSAIGSKDVFAFKKRGQDSSFEGYIRFNGKYCFFELENEEIRLQKPYDAFSRRQQSNLSLREDLGQLRQELAQKTAVFDTTLYDCYLNALSTVLRDVRCIGIPRSHVVFNQYMTEFNLKFWDFDSRAFDADLALVPNSDGKISVRGHSLPEMVKFEHHMLLPSFKEAFELKIQELQVYFHALDNIDSSCEVLDVDRKAPYKIPSRWITIGRRESVRLEFDPFRMDAMPVFKFYCTKKRVEELQQKLFEDSTVWDPMRDAADNILSVLGLDCFPERADEAGAAEGALLHGDHDCSICFSFELNGKTPEVQCPNERCRMPFHHECLYEWFSGLLDAQRICGEVRGKCPNCEQPVSCSVLREAKQ